MDLTSVLIAAAKSVGIAPSILIAVCTTETNLKNVHVQNDGGSPSYGVCQVKLATAHHMAKVYRKPAVASFKGEDLKNPKNNAKVAAKYLKYQLERYDGNLCKAIAAYNAGSYIESKKSPGRPVNIGYVNKVNRNLSEINLVDYCPGTKIKLKGYVTLN